VAGTRLVQAWREAPWDAGAYSLASFELRDEGAGTRLIFDHTGFPRGAGNHLSIGWYDNYWLPMGRYLNVGFAG
jgi:Activator of Hsp90 ATPase homolog 1-like protein